MTGQMYLSLFILSLPLLLFIGRKTHFYYLDKRMDVDNMSDYKLKIIELIESDVTGYQIYNDTGVSQYVLSQLRQGKRDVDNLTLNTTEKLYEYARKVL